MNDKPVKVNLDANQDISAEINFSSWFKNNYPSNSVIANPEWHANNIFKVATLLIESEISKKQKITEQKNTALNEQIRSDNEKWVYFQELISSTGCSNLANLVSEFSLMKAKQEKSLEELKSLKEELSSSATVGSF